MIVALKVQQPVHDQVLQVIDERDALLFGLAGDRLGGKPDVAEEADFARSEAGAGNESTLVGVGLPR